MNPSSHPVVEVTIQSLAAGGDGVGPDASGRVTFVPGSAPGERVRAQITEGKKRYARAKLLEVLEPSPHRVEPACTLFARAQCGGCQWQHIALDEQHRAKTAIVERELRKPIAAGMELLPLIGDVPALGWRRRARLHWFRPRGAERARIGFFMPRTHRVTDVEACPQMDSALTEAIATVRDQLAPHLGGTGDIELLIGESGPVHVSISGWCSPKYASRLLGQGDRPGTIVGVTLHGDGKPMHWGKRTISLEPGLRGRADHFAQASRAGNLALLDAVDRALGGREGQRIVEFHAGAGNLTRAIARTASVEITATDGQRVPWQPDLRIGSAPVVARALIDEGQTFDIAVLDPPRTGAAELMAPLVQLRPSRIVYVSCDPATLARDMDLLHGYRPVSAQPLDLMPQTAHIEVVARLDRER